MVNGSRAAVKLPQRIVSASEYSARALRSKSRGPGANGHERHACPGEKGEGGRMAPDGTANEEHRKDEHERQHDELGTRQHREAGRTASTSRRGDGASSARTQTPTASRKIG